MLYLIVGLLGLLLLFAHYAVTKWIIDLNRLKEHGVTTKAEVTLAHVRRRPRKASEVTLEYKYTDNLGVNRKGLEHNIYSSFVESLNEGDEIGVKYLPQNSKVSCVDHKEAPRKNMWFGMVLLIVFDIAIGFGIYSEFFVGG